MRPVVVAPAPFKGALSAPDAARAIGAGLRLAVTGLATRLVPVADGGEGTMEALVAAAGGFRRGFTVADPLGRPVQAFLGLLPGHRAVVELAQASGYERLAAGERDPEATSTHGTGELIRAALDLGATRILVGVGGSATVDGGLGLAVALGARAYDADGNLLHGRGGDLARLAWIDLALLDPRLADVVVEVACDVDTPLTGPHGAAPVFGPQKGADAAAVARLADGLERLAGLFAGMGRPVADVAGAGAAGGAAAGMAAMLGADLRPGGPLVLEAIGFAERLEGAALCVTGEGRIDATTLAGKAPAAVAAACRETGVPCVAVCGQLGLLPGLVRRMGLAAAFPINRELTGVVESLAATETNLAAMGAAIGGVWAAAQPRGGEGGDATNPT